MALIDKQEFRKAKHGTEEYFLKMQNKKLYDTIKELLRTDGFYRMFYGRRWRYIIIGDYRYWLDPPVCNREIVNDVDLVYQKKLDRNDVQTEFKQKHSERKQKKENIKKETKRTTLDFYGVETTDQPHLESFK